MQAQFIGQLINRRKLYPTDVRDVLVRAHALRETADYQPAQITQTQMARLLRRGHQFVEAIRTREGAE